MPTKTEDYKVLLKSHTTPTIVYEAEVSEFDTVRDLRELVADAESCRAW